MTKSPEQKTGCDTFEPCHGNYACCIHAATTAGTVEHAIATKSEPRSDNREWHDYISGQGGKMVMRYKNQDIHRCGISFYVNGFHVGTSLAAAKRYIKAYR